MRFDLERWGDGTIRLCHWSDVGARDLFFILLPNGTARIATDEYTPHEKSEPVVNLIIALRELLIEIEANE